MSRLTPGQRTTLALDVVEGICERKEWTWHSRNGEPITRAVNSLIRRGLMRATYFGSANAIAHPTPAGRAALARSNAATEKAQ